ncbi:MAG: CarD family transcriptional regulator [Rhodobacteraceae bacterium]|nr:CarD family transcriptional regulator [Paracoccaceae bacterium]
MTKKSKTQKRSEFRANDYVVYPAHGVGKIVSIEERDVAGLKLEMFVISFEKDKMTLRVPTAKVASTGMRGLSSPDVVGKAMDTLKGRAKVKRAMWSRRAMEYEAKINSGDLISIAEVVRDLFRAEDQPEQSYSERQLFEAAFERLTRELAAVERIAEDAAAKRVEGVLVKRAA